jgi:opacity protein-like surface antigen
VLNGLSVGYDWPQTGYSVGVEVAGETGNVENNVSVTSTTGTALSRVGHVASLTANAKMNPMGSSGLNVSPFVKAGLSVTDSYYLNSNTSSSQQTGTGYKAFKTGWTAGVGADVNIAANTDMRFGYNYFRSGNFSHGITTAGTAKFKQTLNQIQMGLRYAF